jgi:small subunit ribosomal protein S9
VVIAIGRRKKAIAQVELVSGGTGGILINGKPAAEYMQGNSRFPKVIQGPLESLGLEDTYDLIIKCSGGGLTGQAEAIQLGLARALIAVKSTNRPPLKAEGFLTRDPRCKERRKYGLKKARKAPQFSKR